MKRYVAATAILLAGVLLGLSRRHHLHDRPRLRSHELPAPVPAPMRRPPNPAAPIILPAANARVDPAASGGLLSGEVRSARGGALVPRAQLVLFRDGVALTVPAPEGRFRFVAPAPGDYPLLTVEAPGFQPFAPELGHSPVVLHLRAGTEISDLVLWLEPAASCAIRVLDPAGRPVSGAVVAQRVPPGPRAVTSAQGEAEIAAVADPLFEARAPGFAPARGRPDSGPECGVTLRLSLLPDGGLREGAIAGRVVDAAGQPVEGARVSAHRAALDPRTTIARRRLGVEAEAHSDVEGRFRLAPLDEDTWDLMAEDATHPIARARARTGQSGVVLALPAAATLRGVVRGADGRPVTAFAVFATERRGARDLERGATRSLSVLDPQGRFELALSAGEYVVSAAARGHGAAPEQALTLGPAGAEVVLTLGRGGRIRGTVRDEATSAPIAGARVELEAAQDEADTPLPTATVALTGPDGRFELSGVSPGGQALLCTAAGHHGWLLSGIAVSPDRDAEVEVALPRTAPGEEPSIELQGIGCVLGPQGDLVLLGECFPGGGGARAGLRPGDAVLRVDGEDVAALGFPGTIGRIRGLEGSTVVLTVRRGDDVSEVPIVRTRVRPGSR